MINKEFISVIMPAFNAEKYIKSSIESVINQSHRNFELLIIDDNSTDKTVYIVKEFIKNDSRINLIKLEHNSGGPAIPRNIGISHSKYGLISFIDADDIWHPQKLELQLQIMMENKINFCSTEAKYFTEEHKIFNVPINKGLKLEKINFIKQLLKKRIPTSSVMMNKDLVKNGIMFNETKQYIAIEDTEFWLKCHDHINYSVKIKIPLVFYRIRNGQISENKFLMSYKYFILISQFKTKNGVVLWPFAIPLLILHWFFGSVKHFISKVM